MQLRASITLGVTTVLLVAACAGNPASPSPSQPAATPMATETPMATATAMATETPMATATAMASESPSGTQFKVGVVTDIGTLNDKNFNEYSYKGAQDGAQAIGLDPNVPSIVPNDASEYATDIQQFVDQGFNVIVTVGFNLATDTAQAAHDNPNIWFIGVDQSPICVDANGLPDATFACAGDAATLLPHYISVNFAEDQAGYLAGIVAASISQSGEIGAIGGTSACAPCVRYIQGYGLGAQSVNANVKVDTAYVVNDFSNAAFNDPVGGNNFATQFLQQNSKVDVMFQVAGKTGNGVLQAACSAHIYGIGVDVDQYVSLNAANDPTYGCIVTSAEKHLESAVSQTIQAIAAGTAMGGDSRFDANNDGIGVSPAQGANASLITPAIQTLLDNALAGMKDGSVVTCPTDGTCGVAQ
jgi:basic membrane protein A and related proteins